MHIQLCNNHVKYQIKILIIKLTMNDSKKKKFSSCNLPKIEHSWHIKPTSVKLEKKKCNIQNGFSHSIISMMIILLA